MNNQPAFPIAAVYDHNREQVNPSSAYGADAGMTLLDYFAAKALPACIQHCERERWAWAAKRAYDLAEAMMAERVKRGL
jgi:hypothetical protein